MSGTAVGTREVLFVSAHVAVTDGGRLVNGQKKGLFWEDVRDRQSMAYPPTGRRAGLPQPSCWAEMARRNRCP